MKERVGRGTEANTLSDRQRQRQTLNICTESEGKKPCHRPYQRQSR